MKRRIKKKREIEKQCTEPIWFNQEIQKAISERRKSNKEKRKAETEKERNYHEERYQINKKVVQRLVKEAKTKHERINTEKIKEDKSKRVWEHINDLAGSARKRDDYTYVYDQEGMKIESPIEIREEIEKCWRPIYTQHRNNMIQEWEENTIVYHLLEERH